MGKPDFLFIGPSKSGSSWFFELLRSHPEVFVPKAKDIYFFDQYYTKGLAWYESFFRAAGDKEVCGEICHDYLSSGDAVERIYKYNPKMKLICCLRNPVDRAVSSYKYFQKNGMALESFEEAIKIYPEIYNEGLYSQYLEKIFSYFPKNQVLILYFEDIANKPSDISEQLFKFIGVDSSFISPYVDKVVNKSASARSIIVARLIKEVALLVRRLGFPTVVGALKANSLVNKILYKSEVLNKKSKVQMPSEMISTYNNDIQKLQKMCDVDLSHWIR